MFVIVVFLSGAGMLLLDRWSKNTVLEKPHCGEMFRSRFFRIKFVANLKWMNRPGAGSTLILLWLLSLSCAITAYRTGVLFQSRLALIGLSLAFGGALGNLLDILQFNYVVDFVDLRWWPVFNLADVGIAAGLFLAFLA